jgi:hypothetical protein
VHSPYKTFLQDLLEKGPDFKLNFRFNMFISVMMLVKTCRNTGLSME